MGRIESLQGDLKKYRKEINELKDQIQTLKSGNLFNDEITITESHSFFDIPIEGNVDMRKLSDDFASKKPNSTGLIYCLRGDKVQFLLRTDKSVQNLDVGKILKDNVAILNGRGGGKPHTLQGSGSSEKFQNFKDNLVDAIKRSLNEN